MKKITFCDADHRLFFPDNIDFICNSNFSEKNFTYTQGFILY